MIKQLLLAGAMTALTMTGMAQSTISSLTQNLKKLDGFYPFYYDQKTGKILLEIDRWNEEFLARVAHCDVKEPGFGMNAIWYD